MGTAEVTITGFAKIRPVAHGGHVLVGGSLGSEPTIAGFAVILRGPVVQVVHVLVTRSSTTEASSASLALDPVPVVGHVVIATDLRVELLVAGCTFIHPEEEIDGLGNSGQVVKVFDLVSAGDGREGMLNQQNRVYPS